MKTKGFTIIELLIAVSITLIIFLVVIVPFRAMNERQVLYKERDNVVSLLKQARSMTVSSKNSLQYGVHVATSSLTLFQGSVYSSTDPNNLVMNLSTLVNITDISIAGGDEVVFTRLSGATANTGTIALSLVASSTQTTTITINQTGIIDFSL